MVIGSTYLERCVLPAEAMPGLHMTLKPIVLAHSTPSGTKSLDSRKFSVQARVKIWGVGFTLRIRTYCFGHRS